jgi:alpha-galactosidase
MKSIKIAYVGAGSQCFGPAIVRDILLSDVLSCCDIELVLMDIVAAHLEDVGPYAKRLNEQLGRSARITTTTELNPAVDGADFVITAFEVDRYFYWTQDFHIPRRYGFRQIYGENGGPGGLFHALRNMGPMLDVARQMEKTCPKAVLLNFANPEHKLCEAVARLTPIRAVGLCHGVHGALRQLAMILHMPVEDLDAAACGINHCTWFQRIRNRHTGEDLYPVLREAEKRGHWLSHWDELALGRILFRRFGLWPSPATNHYGEYLRWADEFWVSNVEYFYDPADGQPWQTGGIPEFVYNLGGDFTPRPGPSPWPDPAPLARVLEHPMDQTLLEPSGELAVPIIESLACGVPHELAAVNVPNRGTIPNMPEASVVEVPAKADAGGLHPCRMEPLPEGIAAILRVQTSIHQLLVEAFAERSKNKLLQAVLLDPTVDSYRRAVEFVDEMLQLQRELLPKFT